MPTRLIVPMRGRLPSESHRTATTLELLFDLVFVVAIAQIAASLHHAIAEGHAGEGLLMYGIGFCAIWWAWMGFTWFATSFDTDDVPYRLTVMVQLAGALIMAAGVTPAFEEANFLYITLGYIVMRVAMVTQWVRAGRSAPAERAGCYRMAGGVALVQLFWVVLLFMPDRFFFPGFFLLLAIELAIPYWAWQKLSELWNKHHIAERYGLLTIIVLGESILGASLAMQSAIKENDLTVPLFLIMVGGLMIVFGLWWLYFDKDATESLTTVNRAFVWGYGHYFVFAAGAAIGAGIGVNVDYATHHAEVSSVVAGMAVAIPTALFLTSLLLLHLGNVIPTIDRIVGFAVIVLVLLTPFTEYPVLLIGVLTMGLVGYRVFRGMEAAAEPQVHS